MSGSARDHYDRLAGIYDENWTHSPQFVTWMSSCITSRLQLHPDDRVMDLGCGTGLFTKALAEEVGQVFCVDPSLGMLDQLPRTTAFVPVLASAEDLVAGRVELPSTSFNAILVKEAIHHVADRSVVLSGLADLLAPGGRILIVMLPTAIEYPLFDAAMKLFLERQPEPGDVGTALENAGLDVTVTDESFQLTFPKERYFGMVRNRFMSLLSAFDDADLELGITEIDNRHPENPLVFPDRFAFVLGHRT